MTKKNDIGYAWVYDLIEQISFILVRVKIEDVHGDMARAIINEGSLKGYGITIPSSKIFKTKEEARN